MDQFSGMHWEDYKEGVEGQIQKKTYKYLFKYKSLSDAISEKRFFDILDKKKIYAAPFDKLNDPFEGQYLCPSLGGYAGCSISQSVGQISQLYEGLKEYGIISLSTDGNNPQLWAHYAASYTGACLIFNTTAAFSRYQNIVYYGKKDRISTNVFVSPEELKEILIDNLFFKEQAWQYEKEVRIVTKGNTHFYSDEDLEGIIIGQNMRQSLQEQIVKRYEGITNLYRTYYNHTDMKIYILPYDMKIMYDGSKLENQIIEYVNKHYAYLAAVEMNGLK